jgi:hypothetical protein
MNDTTLKQSKRGRPPKTRIIENVLDEASQLASKPEGLEAALGGKSEQEPVQEGKAILRELVESDPLSKPHKISSDLTDARLALAAELTAFETHVQYCLNAGIEWIEVSKELLTHLCGGKYPAEHYMIYKNVRVTTEGKSEDIARHEGLTIHEILFKDDKMKYSVGKARQ